jgi:hypothetical protein
VSFTTPADASETVLCPRCGSGMQCGANTGNCWCNAIVVSDAVRGDLAAFYDGCLCRACLQTLQDARPPKPKVWAFLKKNLRRPRS